MIGRGILKSTKIVTRKLGSGEEQEELNLAAITIEIPVESVDDEDFGFLARQQNNVVSVQIDTTFEPVRAVSDDQETMDAAFAASR
jgi:hypothetical protein